MMNEKIYEARNQVAMRAYYNGEIDASTLGQLAACCYSDEIIKTAVERKWIEIDIAGQLLSK